MTSPQQHSESRWPLERALFAMAGTIGLLSVVLAVTVSPWFLLLTGFVGINQLLFAAIGACGASVILQRFFNFAPALSTTKCQR